MSIITEKREFTIPPCRISKKLIKAIGEVLEGESPKLHKELFDITEQTFREREYYQKNPEKLTPEDVEAAILTSNYVPKFSLVSNSRNIQSSNITGFVNAEWPDDIRNISLELGGYSSTKNITVNIYFENWRINESKVVVSGNDSIWVNGITANLASMFKGEKLGFAFIVNHSLLRFILSILTGLSLAFAVMYPLWPIISPFLKEGLRFETFFILIGFFSLVFTAYPLHLFLSWLFPRFEYGVSPLSTRIRRGLWVLLISSGFLSAIILKLLGL